MKPVLLGYAVFLLATGIFVAALAAYAWERRERAGAGPLAFILVGEAIWCWCTFASILTRGTQWALYWSRAWFVGIVITVAGLAVFSLAFTGHERFLDWRTYALLSVEPVLVVGAAAVRPDLLHTLVGPSASSMIGWETTQSTGFWLHAGYSYLLLAGAIVLLIKFALTSPTLRRQQVGALIVAIFAPWIGNMLYLFGGVGFDPTPMSFSVTGVALTWAVFRNGLLDISPVAHREVVASLNSAVFVVDTDDTIIEVNDAGAALLGGGDVTGKHVETVLADWPELRAQYEPATGRPEPDQREIEQDGRHFDVQMSPLFDDRGDLVGRVFLVHEMTEQKDRERELERRNKQLDQFASVVSHDLRNPLNVASGSLALARQSGDPEHFERVERAHERMSRLIDEVLALARDEEAADATALPLADLAQKAWSHVDTKNAVLEADTDRVIVGNRDQLLQLFENAFRNAVEHGGERVTVTVSALDAETGEGGAGPGFAIADDGPGIPADERGEVFDHGYTTNENGTGLGLAIVEHVVESHGWTIGAAESPEGGLQLEVRGVELAEPETAAPSVQH